MNPHAKETILRYIPHLIQASFFVQIRIAVRVHLILQVLSLVMFQKRYSV